MFINAKWFPFLPGFIAIMLFGLIFQRTELNDKQRRHEKIHLEQYGEVACLGFAIGVILVFFVQWFWGLILFPLFLYYAWYMLEYLIRLSICLDHNKAYKSISFEQEAYAGSSGTDCYERFSFIWFDYLNKWYKT